MNFKIPVIVSRGLGTCEDLVDEDKNGYIIDIGDTLLSKKIDLLNNRGINWSNLVITLIIRSLVGILKRYKINYSSCKLCNERNINETKQKYKYCCNWSRVLVCL